MITRIVKLTFKDDKIEEFIKIYEMSKPVILTFKGCHQVELLKDVEQRNVLFTYSIWDTVEELNSYRSSDFFRNKWKHVKTLFIKDPEAWSLQTHTHGG